MQNTPALTDIERQVYEWQMWVTGFGEAGQRRLKGASVSCPAVWRRRRRGCAGTGRGRRRQNHSRPRGQFKAERSQPADSDVPRLAGPVARGMYAERLRALNPRLEVVAVAENVSETNVAQLVGQADVVADCAPLFEERFLLNREAVRQGKPMVECAMYELEAQITAIVPGQTPCLACVYPSRRPIGDGSSPFSVPSPAWWDAWGRDGGHQAADGHGRAVARPTADV